MGRIAVFDSGLGSLSIIRPIRALVRSEVVYFADQANFPYGLMQVARLRKIIADRVSMLEKRFDPDVVVVGSNTPTLLLGRLPGRNTIGVLPPVYEAASASVKSVAVLATRSVYCSTALQRYIKRSGALKKCPKIAGIDCSALVRLVESGDFIHNEEKCIRTIRRTLNPAFKKNCTDAATLSSTHLPFLLPILRRQFPDVKFFDPGRNVARIIKKLTRPSKKSGLSVYTSSDPDLLRQKLEHLKIRRRVSFLA